MPSAFAALEDLVSDACDAVFGEPWELRPMRPAPGGGVRTADDTRDTVTVTGIFSGPLKRSTEFGSEARGSLPAIGNETSVSIDQRQVPAPDRARRFDRLVREATGDVYEISQVWPDVEGRHKCWVKYLATETQT